MKYVEKERNNTKQEFIAALRCLHQEVDNMTDISPPIIPSINTKDTIHTSMTDKNTKLEERASTPIINPCNNQYMKDPEPMGMNTNYDPFQQQPFIPAPNMIMSQSYGNHDINDHTVITESLIELSSPSMPMDTNFYDEYSENHPIYHPEFENYNNDSYNQYFNHNNEYHNHVQIQNNSKINTGYCCTHSQNAFSSECCRYHPY